MFRTSLATRPFYNERVVRLALAAVAAIGLVLLAAGLVRLVDLARRNGGLNARIDRAAGAAGDFAARAAEAQRAAAPPDLTALAEATREANTLITQRVFSWTDFFNRIETTLPPDVMVTEVRPEIEPGAVEVAMGVLGRRLDSIRRFVTALETSGAFSGVLNRQVELTEDGMYRAVLRGRYLESAPLDVSGAGEGELPTDAGEGGPPAGAGEAPAVAEEMSSPVDAGEREPSPAASGAGPAGGS